MIDDKALRSLMAIKATLLAAFNDVPDEKIDGVLTPFIGSGKSPEDAKPELIQKLRDLLPEGTEVSDDAIFTFALDRMIGE